MIWIIDKADECLTVGMTLVLRLVDGELFDNLTLA